MRHSFPLLGALLLGLALTSLSSAEEGAFVRWQQDTYAIWAMKNDRPQQTAVVSWSDWLVFADATFGKPGVRFVLNEMAAAGIRRVWWRTFGGGWALYSSDVDGVTTGNYSGQGADYSQFDSLKHAVDYAHKLGIEIYAWYTPLEEAHAWPDNVRSHYVDAHKDQWDQLRNGQPAGAPSFYYEGYRQYKLALAKEMVTEYDIDGLVIDFERAGAPTRDDQWGYLPPIQQAFKKKTGQDPQELSARDPQWRRFRAQYVGQFMRGVHRLVENQSRDLELVMMYPGSEPLTAHWDAKQWAKRGWIDRFALVSHGSEGWGYPTDKAGRLAEIQFAPQVPRSLIMYTNRGGRSRIWQRTQSALQAGFDRLIWFETTYLHFSHTYDMPRRLACPSQVTVASAPRRLDGGGTLTITAKGAWSLSIDGETIAKGKPDAVKHVTLPRRTGEHSLVLDCELPNEADAAGIAVQGVTIGPNGKSKPVRSDENWRVRRPSGASLTTIGQPGIAPMLAQ
jgi:hypothetical protein